MKRFGIIVAAIAALAVTGNAQALSISTPSISTPSTTTNAAVYAGKKAGEKVAKKGVEASINQRLASFNCAFKGKGTDTTCDLNKVTAELKAQQVVAEKSGSVNWSIDITAYGPNTKTADKRAEVLKGKFKTLFHGWDYNVKGETGGNNVDFKVNLN